MQSRVQKIYDEYLQHLNEKKVLHRYQDRSWFHSSTAGLCARKHYYATIEQMEGVSVDSDTMRLFRLGDLVHTDIQDAVRWWAEANGAPIFIEKELYLEDYNVRGFIDLGFVFDDVLHDIKTCNSWKWRMLFGKSGDPSPSRNYQMQLATYGLWYERTYGSLQGMSLLFYNKDNSKMKELQVPLDFIEDARDYWARVNLLTAEMPTGVHKIPSIELGTTPVYKWECNPKYCQYYEICGGGIKGEEE